MKIQCRTNLDLSHEEWPTELPCVPRVGDCIESKTEHQNGFRLVLEVCSVTWRYETHSEYAHLGVWFPVIELHD